MRILRYFRFQARFGSQPADPEAESACAELAATLKGLSRERIGMEMHQPARAARSRADCRADGRAGRAGKWSCPKPTSRRWRRWSPRKAAGRRARSAAPPGRAAARRSRRWPDRSRPVPPVGRAEEAADWRQRGGDGRWTRADPDARAPSPIASACEQALDRLLLTGATPPRSWLGDSHLPAQGRRDRRARDQGRARSRADPCKRSKHAGSRKGSTMRRIPALLDAELARCACDRRARADEPLLFFVIVARAGGSAGWMIERDRRRWPQPARCAIRATSRCLRRIVARSASWRTMPSASDSNLRSNSRPQLSVGGSETVGCRWPPTATSGSRPGQRHPVEFLVDTGATFTGLLALRRRSDAGI